ncbi:hypothetical protein T484DRAFT_1831015 [Baffinella frigidus]|nr:hypothetical protein T484DRAFT_1831015 [Cryptophyta sp. CCMP2293]
MSGAPPAGANLESVRRSVSRWASQSYADLGNLPPESQMALGAGAVGAVVGGLVVSVLNRPGISLLVVSIASLAILARWILETLETAADRANAGQPLGKGGSKPERMREWWWVKLQREVQVQAGGLAEERGGSLATPPEGDEAGVLDGAGGGGELDEAFEKLMSLKWFYDYISEDGEFAGKSTLSPRVTI